MPTNPVAAALAAVTLGPAVVVSNLTMIPLVGKHHTHGTIRTSTLSTPSTLSTSTVSTFAPLAPLAPWTISSVSYSMMARGDRVSDQSEVWHDIAEKSSRLSADSPTSAMGAIFNAHADSLDAFVNGLQPVDGQVGAMFAIGGRVIGFDLFDRPSTLRKILPKLVRSAAIDAIDESEASPEESRSFRLPPPERAEASRRQAEGSAVAAQGAQFLAVTAKAPQHVTPALGLGEDCRLTAPYLAGAALVIHQQVVHLSAFALE